MKQEMLLISEAAKKVEVETHVLRYWEEELQLPIKRNEMGHRYYTMEDVKRFREIKQLKEQGLQLKAIRTIIKKGNMLMENQEKVVEGFVNNIRNGEVKKESGNNLMPGKKEKFIVSLSDDKTKDDKVIRLQYLLQHMMTEAVKSANQELCAEIKESIIKELDYQFRNREEKEEERFKREEEHFRKIDEMLRERNKLKEKPHKLSRKEKRNAKSYNVK
ncbi:MAG: MerR family transcriptional regulator [Lachnospiraceae bacterium]|nr:MerR family transcriptional regulator [Lachnospiraceae bacterium]